MYYLIDFDHTLSNAFWRDSMIGNVPWDEYHAAAADDKPFPSMVKLIDALYEHGDQLVGITGRTEKHRGITVDWCTKNNIYIHDILMRPDDVFLKNAEMKVQMVSTYFNNYFENIAYLIEDNEETCIAFNKIGIATLQVRNIP